MHTSGRPPSPSQRAGFQQLLRATMAGSCAHRQDQCATRGMIHYDSLSHSASSVEHQCLDKVFGRQRGDKIVVILWPKPPKALLEVVDQSDIFSIHPPWQLSCSSTDGYNPAHPSRSYLSSTTGSGGGEGGHGLFGPVRRIGVDVEYAKRSGSTSFASPCPHIAFSDSPIVKRLSPNSTVLRQPAA